MTIHAAQKPAKLRDMGYFDYKGIYDSLPKSGEPELGPIFITREGRFINVGEDAEHGEIFGDSDYDAEDYYALEDAFGLIKANGGNSAEPIPYIDLWHRPNDAQRGAMTEWLYLLLEHGRKTLQVNSGSDCFEADLTRGIPEEICADIVRRLGYSAMVEGVVMPAGVEPDNPGNPSEEFELDGISESENEGIRAYYDSCDCFAVRYRGDDGVVCAVNPQRFANAYCEIHLNRYNQDLYWAFVDGRVDGRAMSEELVALFFSEVPSQFREELLCYLTDEVDAGLRYNNISVVIAWSSGWLTEFLAYEDGDYNELVTVPQDFSMENGVLLRPSSLEQAMACFVGARDSGIIRCVADIIATSDADKDRFCKTVSGNKKAFQILQRGIITLPDDSDKFVLAALDDERLVDNLLRDSELSLKFSSAPRKIDDDDLFICYAATHFLHEIELPEGLQEIGTYCFSALQYLNSLFIPKTVTTFGEYFLPAYPLDYCDVLFEGEETDYPADFVTDIKADINRLDFGVRFGVSRAKVERKPSLNEGTDSGDDALELGDVDYLDVLPQCSSKKEIPNGAEVIVALPDGNGAIGDCAFSGCSRNLTIRTDAASRPPRWSLPGGVRIEFGCALTEGLAEAGDDHQADGESSFELDDLSDEDIYRFRFEGAAPITEYNGTDGKIYSIDLWQLNKVVRVLADEYQESVTIWCRENTDLLIEVLLPSDAGQFRDAMREALVQIMSYDSGFLVMVIGHGWSLLGVSPRYLGNDACLLATIPDVFTDSHGLMRAFASPEKALGFLLDGDNGFSSSSGLLNAAARALSNPSTLGEFLGNTLNYRTVEKVYRTGVLDYPCDACAIRILSSTDAMVDDLADDFFDVGVQVRFSDTINTFSDETLGLIPVHELELPEGIREIGAKAFSRLRVMGLSKVYIPKTVNEIGHAAFASASDAPARRLTVAFEGSDTECGHFMEDYRRLGLSNGLDVRYGVSREEFRSMRKDECLINGALFENGKLSKSPHDVKTVSAFHGSSKDIISFSKPINWVTPDKGYAKEFALFAAESGYVYSVDASVSDVFDCGNTDGPCYGLRPIPPYAISDNLRRILKALGEDEDTLRKALASAADEYDEPMGGYRMRIHTFIRSDAFARLIKSLGYRCVKCVEGGHESYGMLYAEDLRITGKERISEK